MVLGAHELILNVFLFPFPLFWIFSRHRRCRRHDNDNNTTTWTRVIQATRVRCDRSSSSLRVVLLRRLIHSFLESLLVFLFHEHPTLSAGGRVPIVINSMNTDRSSDPAEWMPPLTSYRCTYARAWVQVKYYYSLTVDSAEKSALTTILNGC